MNSNPLLKTMLAGTALGLFLAATPVSPTFFADDSLLKFEPAVAFAKSGSGKNGNDDDDDDKDDDDDNSGRRSDNDDDDDDDSGRSGSGRSKPRIPGGSGCDDPGDIIEHPECRVDGAGSGSASGGSSNGGSVVKIEISGSNIEVWYADGTKEEIENGRYERKNSAGRTIEQRAATGADIARLKAMANRASGSSAASFRPATDSAAKVEVRGNHVEVVYASGWKEEIEAGRYELKDPFGRTVMQRRATNADRTRMLNARR